VDLKVVVIQGGGENEWKRGREREDKKARKREEVRVRGPKMKLKMAITNILRDYHSGLACKLSRPHKSIR
jgi:hypothetical protein